MMKLEEPGADYRKKRALDKEAEGRCFRFWVERWEVLDGGE
jgi:hypothetical protein